MSRLPEYPPEWDEPDEPVMQDDDRDDGYPAPPREPSDWEVTQALNDWEKSREAYWERLAS